MKKIYVVKEKNCYGVKEKTYFTSKDKCIGFILGKINGHKKACSLKNDKWDYENKHMIHIISTLQYQLLQFIKISIDKQQKVCYNKEKLRKEV